MKDEIDLLNQAAFEIKRLREQNSLMSARLEMFDKCMLLLHTEPKYPNRGFEEDLVWKIEKQIAVSLQTERAGTGTAKNEL